MRVASGDVWVIPRSCEFCRLDALRHDVPPTPSSWYPKEGQDMAGTKSNDKPSNDNRSRQLNPENDAYWRSRGEPGRPDNAATTPPVQEGGQKPG